MKADDWRSLGKIIAAGAFMVAMADAPRWGQALTVMCAVGLLLVGDEARQLGKTIEALWSNLRGRYDE